MEPLCQLPLNLEPQRSAGELTRYFALSGLLLELTIESESDWTAVCPEDLRSLARDWTKNRIF